MKILKILASLFLITNCWNNAFADKIFFDSATGPDDFYIGETNLTTWLKNAGGLPDDASITINGDTQYLIDNPDFEIPIDDENVRKAINYETESPGLMYEERECAGETVLWVTGISENPDNGMLVIPAYHDGKKVQGIAGYADLDIQNITTLVFWGEEIEPETTGPDGQIRCWPEPFENLYIPNVKILEEGSMYAPGRGISQLQYVYAPKLERVGNWVFSNSKLQRIDFPSLKYAGTDAFRSTPATEVIVPELLEMNATMFGSNVKLLYVPKVKKVRGSSNSAYQTCFRSITNLYLPSCEEFGNHCFYGSEEFPKHIYAPKLKRMGKDNWLPGLVEINFPLCTEWEAKMVIPKYKGRPEHHKQYYYPDNTSLTRVVLGVEKLRDHAFRRCRELQAVELPNLIQGGRWAFEGCTNLFYADLPKMTKSAWGMFQNCSKLGYVNMPNSLDIEGEMFFGCERIHQVIDEPKEKAVYGEYAIKDVCKKLGYDAANDKWYYYPWQEQLFQKYNYLAVVASKVKIIGSEAFKCNNRPKKEKFNGQVVISERQVRDVSTTDGETIFVAANDGIWKSDDGGTEWERIEDRTDVWSISAFDKTNYVINGRDQYGIYPIATYDGTNIVRVTSTYRIETSHDGGQSWTWTQIGDYGEYSDIAMRKNLCVATINDGSYCWIQFSYDYGDTWDGHQILNTHIYSVAISDNYVYFTFTDGIKRCSLDDFLNGNINLEFYYDFPGNNESKLCALSCSMNDKNVFAGFNYGTAGDLYKLFKNKDGDVKQKQIGFYAKPYYTYCYSLGATKNYLFVFNDHYLCKTPKDNLFNVTQLPGRMAPSGKVVCSDNYVYYTDSGLLYRDSENGEESSDELSGGVAVLAVTKDDSLLYTANWDSEIYKSTDKGESWEDITSINIDNIDIQYMYIYDGMLYFSDGFRIYRVNKYGETEKIFEGYETFEFIVADENTIYSRDDERTLFKYTKIGELTWERKAVSERECFDALALDSNNVLYGMLKTHGGQNTLSTYQIKTTNTSNLKVIDLPSLESIGAAAFENQLHLKSIQIPRCEVIGSTAFKNCGSAELSIYKDPTDYPTHDRGMLGTTLIQNAGVRDVATADGQTVYVGCQDERPGVWKSIDGGKTFKQVFDQDVYSISSPYSNIVYIANEGNAWKSIDGGENWTRLRELNHVTSFENVVFGNDGNEIYKSEDFGETWNYICNWDIEFNDIVAINNATFCTICGGDSFIQIYENNELNRSIEVRDYGFDEADSGYGIGYANGYIYAGFDGYHILRSHIDDLENWEEIDDGSPDGWYGIGGALYGDTIFACYDNNSMWKLNGQTKTFEKTAFKVYDFGRILSISSTGDSLYITENKNYYIWKSDNGNNFSPLDTGNLTWAKISTISTDNGDIIYGDNAQGGINTYQNGNYSLLYDYGTEITSIIVDDTNSNVYFATANKNLFKFNITNNNIINISPNFNFPHNEISSICLVGDEIYINDSGNQAVIKSKTDGTTWGGNDVISETTINFQTLDGKTIYYQKQNKNELYKINTDTYEETKIINPSDVDNKNFVYCLDKNGIIHIITSDGAANIYEYDTTQITPKESDINYGDGDESPKPKLIKSVNFDNVRRIENHAFANAGFGEMKFEYKHEPQGDGYYLKEWEGITINLPSAMYVDSNAFENAERIKEIIMPEVGGSNKKLEKAIEYETGTPGLIFTDDETDADYTWVVGYEGEAVDTLVIPAFYDGKKVKGISSSFDFGACANTLTTFVSWAIYVTDGQDVVAWPKTLTTAKLPLVEKMIGHEFENCENLKIVEMPKLEIGGDYSFAGCSSYINIDLPKLQVCGNGMFKGCGTKDLSIYKTNGVITDEIVGYTALVRKDIKQVSTTDGKTVYATTSDGIWKSEDSGNSWIIIKQVSGNNIIASYNDIIYVYSWSNDEIYKSTDGGKTWNKISFPNTCSILETIDGNTVYGSVDKYLYKSEDGGENWERVSGWDNDIGQEIYDIKLLNNDTIYICDEESLSDKLIKVSYDGGDNWTIIVANHYLTHLAISTNGIIYGGYDELALVSYDDGHTFDYIQTSLNNEKCSMSCSRDGSVLFIMDYDNNFYKIVKNGNEFTYEPTAFVSQSLTKVTSFSTLDGNTIYVVADGDIYKSANGGKTWEFYDGSFTWYYVSIADNNNVIYASSGNELYVKNINSDWVRIGQDKIGDKTITALQITPDNTFVYVACGDCFYREDTDGYRWSGDLNPGFESSVVKLSIGRDGTLCAGYGEDDDIWISTNKGDSWTKIETENSYYCQGLCILDKNTIYTVSDVNELYKYDVNNDTRTELFTGNNGLFISGQLNLDTNNYLYLYSWNGPSIFKLCTERPAKETEISYGSVQPEANFIESYNFSNVKIIGEETFADTAFGHLEFIKKEVPNQGEQYFLKEWHKPDLVFPTMFKIPPTNAFDNIQRINLITIGNGIITQDKNGNFTAVTYGNRKDDSEIGPYSIAHGINVIASGDYSIASGENAKATGLHSIAIGKNVEATGEASHAEGGGNAEVEGYPTGTEASGEFTHSEGTHTLASGDFSHSEGSMTKASGTQSHTEGWNTTASGSSTHAEGKGTKAIGENSHAEGLYTVASNLNSHAEGDNTQSLAYNTHTEGSLTIANRDNAHAEGEKTLAAGIASHSEGYTTKAKGKYSHAEGQTTSALGDDAHSEGSGSYAVGSHSHAEGYQTFATANQTHTEGNTTVAAANRAHAEGYLTAALGSASHAEGTGATVSGAANKKTVLTRISDEDPIYRSSVNFSSHWSQAIYGIMVVNSDSVYVINEVNGNSITLNKVIETDDESSITAYCWMWKYGAKGNTSHVAGYRATANADYSWVWNGINTVSNFSDRGVAGTFNINPSGGASGFYIGDQSLQDYLDGAGNTKIENVVTNIGMSIDLSTEKNEIYFSDPTANITNYIVLPQSDYNKLGKIIIYVEENPYENAYYDFTGALSDSFANLEIKPWLNGDDNTVWKFELISPPGTTKWNCNIFKEYKKEIGPNTIAYYSDGRKVIYDISGNLTESSIDRNELIRIEIGSKVTNIGNYAFEFCYNLENVIIGNNVTNIGNHAFEGCHQLSSVIFGDNVISIGNNAFTECYNLGNLLLNNKLEKIDNYAFNECGFSTLELPNTLKSIGTRSFEYCSELTSLTIPNNVTNISEEAFYCCTSLTNVTILGNIVNDWASSRSPFNYCNNLTTVILGEKMTKIGNSMFYNCQNLKNVTILGNIINTWTASSRPFYNCTNLTTVTLGEKVSQIGNYMFYSCSSLSNITCLATSAPTVNYGAFGTSSFYYTGRNSYSTGNNVLRIPQDATGYDSSYWYDPLRYASKCGFHIEYITE